jgi:hypothetical protein
MALAPKTIKRIGKETDRIMVRLLSTEASRDTHPSVTISRKGKNERITISRATTDAGHGQREVNTRIRNVRMAIFNALPVRGRARLRFS